MNNSVTLAGRQVEQYTHIHLLPFGLHCAKAYQAFMTCVTKGLMLRACCVTPAALLLFYVTITQCVEGIFVGSGDNSHRRRVIGGAATAGTKAGQLTLTWPPTYNMSLSTISNPDGNTTGPDAGLLLARDAKYGIITFDGNFEECLNTRVGPAEDPCRYKSKVADAEEQARNIKAINSKTRVFTYRNQLEMLLRNGQDCPLMKNPAYDSWYIRNASGIVNHQNPVRHRPW